MIYDKVRAKVSVSQAQVAGCLADKEDATLMAYETSKVGRQANSWVSGLKEMPDKVVRQH